MQFNSAAFKAKWREICKNREIDPIEGATSFQVAAYKAELDEERKRQQPKWWMTPEGAAFWESFQVRRSDVDSEDVYQILLAAKRAVKELNHIHLFRPPEELTPVDVAIRQIWQEVKAEMRRDVVHQIPARDLHKMPKAAIVVMV